MKAQAEDADRAGAAVTLTRASNELRRTVTMVEDLESVLSLALAGGAEADQMLELQKLDHICQKIIGVADFLEALGLGVPGDWKVDAQSASRIVLLAELGARLGAPEAPEATSLEPSEANFELF